MNRLLIGCLILSVSLVGAQTTDPVAEAHAKVTKGTAKLVDVRETDEWNEGHLKGAVHIPLSQITKGLDAKTLNSLKNVPVYVHCKAGIRAQKAAVLLKSSGIQAKALKTNYETLEKVFGSSTR